MDEVLPLAGNRGRVLATKNPIAPKGSICKAMTLSQRLSVGQVRELDPVISAPYPN